MRSLARSEISRLPSPSSAIERGSFSWALVPDTSSRNPAEPVPATVEINGEEAPDAAVLANAAASSKPARQPRLKRSLAPCRSVYRPIARPP